MTTDNAFNEKDISKIIDENIVIVLERFNCCTCDVCKEHIYSNVLNCLASSSLFVGNHSEKEARDAVISELLKNVIILKNKPIHKKGTA